jgi:hypothetical protein
VQLADFQNAVDASADGKVFVAADAVDCVFFSGFRSWVFTTR